VLFVSVQHFATAAQVVEAAYLVKDMNALDASYFAFTVVGYE
jgi:hypothetical protein